MNKATPPRTKSAVFISLVNFKFELVYRTYKLNIFLLIWVSLVHLMPQTI